MCASVFLVSDSATSGFSKVITGCFSLNKSLFFADGCFCWPIDFSGNSAAGNRSLMIGRKINRTAHADACCICSCNRQATWRHIPFHVNVRTKPSDVLNTAEALIGQKPMRLNFVRVKTSRPARSSPLSHTHPPSSLCPFFLCSRDIHDGSSGGRSSRVGQPAEVDVHHRHEGQVFIAGGDNAWPRAASRWDREIEDKHRG